MNIIKPADKRLDSQISKEIPSQLPVTAIRLNYEKMLRHCMSQTARTANVWACGKTGARIKAKMVKMNVFNRETGAVEYFSIPIVHIYCTNCHKEPVVRGGDPIYSDLLMTLAM